jgi:hypothetical protein
MRVAALHNEDAVVYELQLPDTLLAEAYTRPLFSSIRAVLVAAPGIPMSNHAPNVSHKVRLR